MDGMSFGERMPRNTQPRLQFLPITVAQPKLGRRDKRYLARRFDHEGSLCLLPIPGKRGSLFCTCECSFKSRLVERLQQTIESAHLESAQFVVVVGGHEDGAGRVASQHLDHIEAVTLGHLHVEKDKIGFPQRDSASKLAG